MAFQFPASPTIGQLFTPIPSLTYQFDGIGWAPYNTQFLTISNAATTYLAKTDAAATYLSIANAATLYLALAGGTLTGPVVINDGTANTTAITAHGNGSGYGVIGYGGPTGTGVYGQGGNTSYSHGVAGLGGTAGGHGVQGIPGLVAEYGVVGYTQNSSIYGGLGYNNAWSFIGNGPSQCTMFRSTDASGNTVGFQNGNNVDLVNIFDKVQGGSYGNPGYIEFGIPNLTIHPFFLQFGSYTTTSVAQGTNFAVAFPHAVFAVAITVYLGGPGNATAYTHYLYNGSHGGVNLSGIDVSYPGGGSSYSVYWIALGY